MALKGKNSTLNKNLVKLIYTKDEKRENFISYVFVKNFTASH